MKSFPISLIFLLGATAFLRSAMSQFNFKLDQSERAAAVRGFPEAATCLRTNPGDILSKNSRFRVANGWKYEKIV